MISLPNTQTIVEDSVEDSHIDHGDIQVTFTYAEHELINDVLTHVIDSLDFACPYGLHELPIDNETVRRYTMIENLRERFNVLWSDRFESIIDE